MDSNSFWLSKTMLPYDINVLKMVTVGDDHNTIINESRKMLQGQFDYLFVTGGLGPTHDDVTKKAFCELFSDEMSLDKEYLSQLKNRFEILSKNMPKINHSQAMLLKNADAIPNDLGSALGMHYFENGTHVFILPGIPDEMKNMVLNHIIPNYLKGPCKEKSVTIRTAGIMESHLAEKIENMMEKYSSSCSFAFLPHYTGVSFRIRQKNSENLSF